MAIIIADDDMGHACLTRNTLRHKGIANEIIHFQNGTDLLNFLFRRGDGPHRIDSITYVLLLDIQLSDTDGIEILRQIKENPILADMPIIIHTSNDDPWVIDKCHELGCSLYIAKPLDFGEFAETVSQFGLFLKMVLEI